MEILYIILEVVWVAFMILVHASNWRALRKMTPEEKKELREEMRRLSHEW